MDVEPSTSQRVCHGLLEGGLIDVGRRANTCGEGTRPVDGELHVVAKKLSPIAGCTREIDVCGKKRADKPDLVSSASYRDVQPPLPARSIERTEVHTDDASSVRPIPDTEYNRVPFVALHILQILHEERFSLVLLEEPIEARVSATAPLDLLQNRHLLGLTERDDAERTLGR